MNRRLAIKTAASAAVLGGITATHITSCGQQNASTEFSKKPTNYLKEGELFRNSSAGVIGVSDSNPHYFSYKGKEILLITSAEHYGAIINKHFDFVKYLDMLAEYGLNYTRIYPGAIIEPIGYWMSEDMMAPGENAITPWARSDIPGYICGGNKFDLSQWDHEYFVRLRDFLTYADKLDIIVEICFFNCMQEKYWVCSPLHKDANIQGVGDCDHITFQTLDNEPLVREQLKYIEKIMVETNNFDNVIYEFCDEPTTVLTPSHKAYLWIDKQVDTAIEIESRLPKKHILAQQLEIGVDFACDDRVPLIVTQYISLCWRQIGGVPALNSCYCYNKPIELNETAYIGSWIKEKTNDVVAISRLEAWEFMVGGGAGFNQLNGYFVPSNPSGENEYNRMILSGLRNLRTFLESFDFIKMTRDRETVRKASIGTSINMIAEKGRQYAMYIHHSFPVFSNGSYYEPNYGTYETVLTLRLVKGDYNVVFIEPETLKILKETVMKSDGADITLTCPRYTLDLAIKITNI
jgi:hypothetical protein